MDTKKERERNENLFFIQFFIFENIIYLVQSFLFNISSSLIMYKRTYHTFIL